MNVHDDTELALMAKVAAWQAVLDAYRLASTTSAVVSTFSDKTMPEAIKLFLASDHRHQKNKDIAAGILRGGIETASLNFQSAVAVALHRMKKQGIVLRFADGWDLASRYDKAVAP